MNDLFFDKPKNRLELLMQENNYTLKKVSENTGIPVTTLSGYKKNLRTPKKENALKLADYFRVSVPYLLGLDDNPVYGSSGGVSLDNRLKELRKDKGLTQADLAKVINTNQSQYGKYENGKTSLSIENSKILADFFGVSIPYLLGLDDNPNLVDPGAPKEVLKGFTKILQGKNSIDNKITKWTPFGDELAIILKEINQSELLADYIDFLASKKDFNPILVKAIKEFIADEKQGLIPFLINKSGGEDSPYHYVWQAWENSEEYKAMQKAKKD